MSFTSCIKISTPPTRGVFLEKQHIFILKPPPHCSISVKSSLEQHMNNGHTLSAPTFQLNIKILELEMYQSRKGSLRDITRNILIFLSFRWNDSLVNNHTAGCGIYAQSHSKWEVLINQFSENPVKLQIRIWIKNQHFKHRKFTYIDQAKIMLIHRELLRTNLFLQSRSIGALQKNNAYVRENTDFFKNPKAFGNNLLPLKISTLCLLCSSELNEYDALSS